MTPLVYDELRRLAASYLRRRIPGDSLQPALLVHEAWLRLVNRETADPGVVMWTAVYMSPEQVRGQEADTRADIFSFGVILYEM